MSYSKTKMERKVLKKMFNNDQSVVSSDELKNYIENNPQKSAQSIANHFGKNRSHIRSLITKYKIEYKSKNEPKVCVQDLREYVKNNFKKTSKEIGEHFGVSAGRIIVLIRQHKIEGYFNVNKPRVTPNELRKYIKNNPSDTLIDIGSVFNLTESALSRYIKKHNIEYIRKK